MSESEDKKSKTPAAPIVPVKPSEFGRAQHTYTSHNAIVASGTKEKDLTKADLWDHVAYQLKMYDEVRAIAEDGSFVATLIVTFKHANKALLTVTNFTKLETVSFEEEAGLDRYSVKQRGVKKWCIIDNNDASVVEELIPTQAEAYKKLEEFLAVRGR